uniref:Protein naked cuticle homolog n=1 Tax=Oncorhynchus tshawytscha TaxID=74940 RepID=A0AAZ3Q6U9_ONCTS
SRVFLVSPCRQDLECDVSVEEDNRQEWIFTLYDFDNSGKVTKEDMSSLMHTIYDVVDASVHHSSCHSKRKTLRVKLTVAPEPSARRRDHLSTGPGKRHGGRDIYIRLSSYTRPALPGQSSEGQHYCVDENTERRNHYLDLAGIENYTSRFEGWYHSAYLSPYTNNYNVLEPDSQLNLKRIKWPCSELVYYTTYTALRIHTPGRVYYTTYTALRIHTPGRVYYTTYTALRIHTPGRVYYTTYTALRIHTPGRVYYTTYTALRIHTPGRVYYTTYTALRIHTPGRVYYTTYTALRIHTPGRVYYTTYTALRIHTPGRVYYTTYTALRIHTPGQQHTLP